MSIMSEVAALHQDRYVVTILHEPFVDCGCPHATGARILAHRVVVKPDATPAQAKAIMRAWGKYHPAVTPASRD